MSENNPEKNKDDIPVIIRDDAPPEKISQGGIVLFLLIQLLALVAAFMVIMLSGNYGWTLFLIIPFSIGLTIGVYSKTYRSKSFLKGAALVLAALAGISGLLIIGGFEGAICILMAEGLIALPAFLGMLLGYFIRSAHILYILFLIVLLNSSAYVYDVNDESKIISLTTTSVMIKAPAEKIWKVLTQPVDFTLNKNMFFKAGIIHPTSMQLESAENGQCFLNCKLSHGFASLPVLKIDSMKSIRFAIPDTIVPMQELTFYDSIDAPHLHGYFAADYGEFTINDLGNGKAELIANTSYSYKITPVFYWRWWSDYLVNTMHKQVLYDIKTIAEKGEAN